MFNRPTPFSFCLFVIAAVLASSTSVQAAEPAGKLQSLVNDTAAQIQLAYQRDPNERDERQRQVAAVLAVWRSAPRSEANNEQLAIWLRAAIASSMPGSREPLPAAPNFATATKTDRKPEVSVVKQSADKPMVKSAAESTAHVDPKNDDVDPFRDDPVSETK
jgi:hypothetical protein